MFNDKKIIDFLKQAIDEKTDLVYINVLETQGDAFRKTGATMIVKANGVFTGIVRGGGFEKEIVQSAKEVLTKNTGKYIVHDLRVEEDNPDSWGHSIGCNGVIKLWMEPFYSTDNYGSLGLALQYALKGQTKTLIRSIDDSRKYSFIEKSYKTNSFYDESNNIFLQNIILPFKLIILGAGPGSEALLQIAHILGWQTTICDTRDSILQTIQSSDEKILLSSLDNLDSLNIDSFDAGVIMSHNLSDDTEYLKELVFSKIDYIGIMGPQKRTKEIMDSIENIHKAKLLDTRLHSPIGLNLGGETPESIALSISSEIESRRNKTIPLSLKTTN